MTRQKIGVIVGSVVASLLLIGGGFVIGHHGLSGKKLNLEEGTSSAGTAASSSVPLNQTQASSDSGGLSVSSGSSGASNLGQLGDKSSTTQGNSQSGGSGSSSSNDPNPATFADYEKYKDQQHALFGDIVKGTGDELVANKKAAVYYKGWLTNGKMFDQSPITNGQRQPLIFTLGSHEVVPGMEEGTLGMKVGGKRLILVPPAAGYGEAGNGPVPANSLMVFEVELITVQ